MRIDGVPVSLREQLGPDATAELLQLVARTQQGGREDMIATCTERFERRLAEEIGGVRVQLAQVESNLRQAMGAMDSNVRQEITSGRVEIVRWSFLFWIGQVVAITAIVGAMLRVMRP